MEWISTHLSIRKGNLTSGGKWRATVIAKVKTSRIKTALISLLL
jgi:hypothetical protein